MFIGGPSGQAPRVTITPEVPAWAVTKLTVLGIAGAIAALPFAVATVGVAATFGGVVLGAVGAHYGAEGGRALGEALAMSEAGIRSLEVAGGSSAAWPAARRGRRAPRHSTAATRSRSIPTGWA